jgi:hypothetical protein
MTLRAEALSTAKGIGTKAWLRPRHLLLAAAIFHLVVTLGIYAVGRYQTLPRTFDRFGVAFPNDSDGPEAREEAAKLSEILVRGEIRNWAVTPSPFHLKLYSVCFALLGAWFGPTILSAESLNSLCYLAILALIVQLGQEAFNRRTGLIAAATVALWPSFLLHTTQLLKDPMFLVAMLALVLVNLRFITENFSWRKTLGTGAAGGLITAFIWIVRDNMGQLIIFTLVLAAAILIGRQFCQKSFRPAPIVGMALMILISVAVMLVVPRSSKPHLPDLETPSSNPMTRFAMQVGKARLAFVNAYPNSGSNIDSEVRITSAAELAGYLPRAAVIGFLAPFPDMWFTSGKHVGRGARMISGLETTAMFAVEGLALVGLWINRRRVSAWWLLLVAAMGMISLGLVVVNVGALFRLRYVFLILLLVLATEGAAQVWDRVRYKRFDRSAPAADKQTNHDER